MGNRWIDDVPTHLYLRGVNGWVVFYRLEDHIFYSTLLRVISEKNAVQIICMSLMVNHVHILVKTKSKQSLSAFIYEINKCFAKKYNAEYHRSGRVFQRPCGRAQKKVGKYIRSCAAYICNNPVAGNLSRTAEGYRWTFLSYLMKRYPFSCPIQKSRCSHRLRMAMDFVKIFSDNAKPLDYAAQSIAYKRLTPDERRQLTDYILWLYNPVDKTELAELYGNLPTALRSFKDNAGQEHDLPDDWCDYSLYREGISILKKIFGDKWYFIEEMSEDQLRKAYSTVSSSGMSERMIRKLLHIAPPG